MYQSGFRLDCSRHIKLTLFFLTVIVLTLLLYNNDINIVPKGVQEKRTEVLENKVDKM